MLTVVVGFPTENIVFMAAGSSMDCFQGSYECIEGIQSASCLDPSASSSYLGACCGPHVFLYSDTAGCHICKLLQVDADPLVVPSTIVDSAVEYGALARFFWR